MLARGPERERVRARFRDGIYISTLNMNGAAEAQFTAPFTPPVGVPVRLLRLLARGSERETVVYIYAYTHTHTYICICMYIYI